MNVAPVCYLAATCRPAAGRDASRRRANGLDDTGSEVAVVLGEQLARYGFGCGHPFGTDRPAAFQRESEQRGLHRQVVVLEPREANIAELELFHSPAHVRFVM